MDDDIINPPSAPTPPPALPQNPVPQPPPPSQPAPSPPRHREGWRNILSTVLVLLIAPLIAITLIAFVFQSYEVSGPSMQTTLNDKDRLIVWKVPRTWARITGKPYIPRRGEVVVFVSRHSVEQGKQLIKRVIALPGERVVVQNGVLTVYSKEHPNGFQPDTTLPYGKVITTTLPETDKAEWIVGEGEVFVCGDKRTNSYDSRTFGPISADDIIGKLSFRVLPLDRAQHF